MTEPNGEKREVCCESCEKDRIIGRALHPHDESVTMEYQVLDGDGFPWAWIEDDIREAQFYLAQEPKGSIEVRVCSPWRPLND